MKKIPAMCVIVAFLAGISNAVTKEYRVIHNNNEIGAILIDSKETGEGIEFNIFRQYVIENQNFIDSTYLLLKKVDYSPIRTVSRKKMFLNEKLIFDNLSEVTYGIDTIIVKGGGDEHKIPLTSKKPVYDGENLLIELQKLSFKKGKELNLPIFFPQFNKILEALIKIDEDVITLDKDKISTYRVKVSYQKRDFTYWFSKKSPHHLIKLFDSVTGFTFILKND